jgi:DNA-binding Lrp family transcriptional regulator
MILKPQDILVVLKLVAYGGREAPFAQLGQELGMSASETHAAFHRACRAGLIQAEDGRPVKRAVAEFLLHGLKYLLPVRPGKRTRGIPTGFAAPPLSRHFAGAVADQDVPVWPDPEGEQAGLEIIPICRSAPGAALRDPVLYEWLVLADAVRGVGRARERELAESMIRERLGYHAAG